MHRWNITIFMGHNLYCVEFFAGANTQHLVISVCKWVWPLENCVLVCVCVWMAAMGEGRRTPSTMCKNPSKWLCTRMAIHSLETGEYKLYVSVTSLSVVKRQKIVVRNESRMFSLSVMASSLVNSNWIHIGINVALTHTHTHTLENSHTGYYGQEMLMAGQLSLVRH